MKYILPLLILPLVLACGIASPLATSPAPITETATNAVSVPPSVVPIETPHIVSMTAFTALNIREGRGIEYFVLREVPEGTYLFAVCYADGWCFDREQAGWFCLEAAVSGGGCSTDVP